MSELISKLLPWTVIGERKTFVCWAFCYCSGKHLDASAMRTIQGAAEWNWSLCILRKDSRTQKKVRSDQEKLQQTFPLTFLHFRIKRNISIECKTSQALKYQPPSVNQILCLEHLSQTRAFLQIKVILQRCWVQKMTKWSERPGALAFQFCSAPNFFYIPIWVNFFFCKSEISFRA